MPRRSNANKNSGFVWINASNAFTTGPRGNIHKRSAPYRKKKQKFTKDFTKKLSNALPRSTQPLEDLTLLKESAETKLATNDRPKTSETEESPQETIIPPQMPPLLCIHSLQTGSKPKGDPFYQIKHSVLQNQQYEATATAIIDHATRLINYTTNSTSDEHMLGTLQNRPSPDIKVGGTQNHKQSHNNACTIQATQWANSNQVTCLKCPVQSQRKKQSIHTITQPSKYLPEYQVHSHKGPPGGTQAVGIAAPFNQDETQCSLKSISHGQKQKKTGHGADSPTHIMHRASSLNEMDMYSPNGSNIANGVPHEQIPKCNDPFALQYRKWKDAIEVVVFEKFKTRDTLEKDLGNKQTTKKCQYSMTESKAKSLKLCGHNSGHPLSVPEMHSNGTLKTKSKLVKPLEAFIGQSSSIL